MRQIQYWPSLKFKYTQMQNHTLTYKTFLSEKLLVSNNLLKLSKPVVLYILKILPLL